MKCPNCNTTLLMTERNKIEIDYCPSCRGVWLDRGELDKIIDHGSVNSFNEDMHVAEYQKAGFNNSNSKHHKRNNQHKNSHAYRYKKLPEKRSFLSDLFDFN